MKPILALGLLALAGCATTPVSAPPQIVTVTKVRYVPLPAADLLPCVVRQAAVVTGADVIHQWQLALGALAVCNGQISDLRKLRSK